MQLIAKIEEVGGNLPMLILRLNLSVNLRNTSGIEFEYQLVRKCDQCRGLFNLGYARF